MTFRRTKVGQIRSTTTLSILEVFRPMEFPQMIKRIERSDTSENVLRALAEKKGIQLMEASK